MGGMRSLFVAATTTVLMASCADATDPVEVAGDARSQTSSQADSGAGSSGSALPISGVFQVSADGSRLTVEVEVGCPEATVETIEVHESEDSVDLRALGLPAGEEPYEGYCAQEIARPPVREDVLLASPLGDRELLVDGDPASWSYPRGSVPVRVSIASAPDARGVPVDESLGLAFDRADGCYLIWPWDQPAAQEYIAPVPVAPGERLSIYLAPMDNPAPGVVEPCPDAPAGPASSFEMPSPEDVAARLNGLVLTLGQDLVTGPGEQPVVDGAKVSATWEEA